MYITLAWFIYTWTSQRAGGDGLWLGMEWGGLVQATVTCDLPINYLTNVAE